MLERCTGHPRLLQVYYAFQNGPLATQVITPAGFAGGFGRRLMSDLHSGYLYKVLVLTCMHTLVKDESSDVLSLTRVKAITQLLGYVGT